MPLERQDYTDRFGLLLERLPTRTLPACRDLPSLPTKTGLHLLFQRFDTAQDAARWVASATLTRFEVPLPPQGDITKHVNGAWVLPLLFQEALLAALHTFDPVDVRAWLKAADPKVLDVVAKRLGEPGPLGAGPMRRDGAGVIRALPGRPDRVVVLKVAVEEGEEPAVRGRINLLKQAQVQ